MLKFGLGYVVNLFKNGSVCVTGLRGTGKDVLFGNVIARRKKPYVSNLDYGGEREALNLSLLNMGQNTYDRFINDTLNKYHHPFKKGADIYISDVGVYLPSQYCNELNKKYSYLPTYVALSRQVSRNNVHFNVQNLNRAWDKLREQSDIYIMCRRCIFLGPLAILSVTIYDKAESCQARVRPCRISAPFFCSKEKRLQLDIYKDNFYNTHGEVRDYTFIFFNRSKHDTYDFEKKLGVTYNENVD